MTTRPLPPKTDKDRRVLYVYGTLRPGVPENCVKIPGVMCDLGWYPGVKLLSPKDGQFFVAERITVDDEGVRNLDAYEGYNPSSPNNSLYLRVPYMDGEIYVYNSDMKSRKVVEGGDWLAYTKEKRGSASDMVQPSSLPAGIGHNSDDDEGVSGNEGVAA